MYSLDSFGLIGYNFGRVIGWAGIQSKIAISMESLFYLSHCKINHFKIHFLYQICLNFTSVFYFEVINAFKFPIQLFVLFDKVRNVRNINALTHCQKICKWQPTPRH